MRDLLGSCWGVLVFTLAAVAPGFALAHLCAPAWFRTRALREQLAWAVCLSFGPGVLLVVGSVAVEGAGCGALVLLLCGVAAMWFARMHPPRRDVSRKQLRVALIVMLTWTMLVLCSLVDIYTAHGLSMSVTAYDHGLRTAFVNAVLRTGVAPVDPVYWPGHDAPMRYYYFWYAVCASVARLAHISARQALISSCVWPLQGVVAILALFGRYVLGLRGHALAHRTAVGAALLAVTGLDILVTLALHALHTPVLPDMEWWAPDQVASWLDTFLWVPHHAAALVAVLFGLLLLLLAAEEERSGTRLALATVAGLSYAAAFGMSSYLGFGGALLTAGWLLRRLFLRGGKGAAQASTLAASVAFLTLSKFLWQLMARQGSKASAAPLFVGVREILLPTALAKSMFASLALVHPRRARELAALVLLLPGWGVELGFFGVALLCALLRWRRSSAGERTVIWLAVSGMVAASFVRSGVISTNDYGIRAALLPQFFLLLIAAWIIGGSAPGLRGFLSLLIMIGVAGCVYQLILLRTYLPWQQKHGNPEFAHLSERALALRTAYTALDARSARNARVQLDPADKSFYLYPHLLFSTRPFVSSEIPCNISFGGDPAACPGIASAVGKLFPPAPAATPAAADARPLCAAAGIQYLVVSRWNAAWNSPGGWVWTLPAVVSQPEARVLDCSAGN